MFTIWNPRARQPHFAGSRFANTLYNLRSFDVSKFPGLRALHTQFRRSRMNSSNVENIVVDEANERTYVVLARRALTDGEIYSAIRKEILRLGHNPLARGETLTVTSGEHKRSRRKSASAAVEPDAKLHEEVMVALQAT